MADSKTELNQCVVGIYLYSCNLTHPGLLPLLWVISCLLVLRVDPACDAESILEGQPSLQLPLQGVTLCRRVQVGH